MVLTRQFKKILEDFINGKKSKFLKNFKNNFLDLKIKINMFLIL